MVLVFLLKLAINLRCKKIEQGLFILFNKPILRGGKKQHEFESVSKKLRHESNKRFDNLIDLLYYPEQAVHQFLKSRSHVLKLRSVSEEELDTIEG